MSLLPEMTYVWRSTVLAVVAACSAASKPQPAGGQCLLVSDCQDGLVCVKQRCSNDLSGLVNIEDTGAAPPPAVNDGGPASDADDASQLVEDDASDAAGDDAIQDAPAPE